MMIQVVPCRFCPLRNREAFRSNTDAEIDFIQNLKVGEAVAPAGSIILREGDKADRLFTLLDGWAFRFKTLPGGRRQILNVLLPGDLIGLQAKLFDAATHGIEALTDVRLCVFSRGRVWEIFTQFPDLAFDLTWLSAVEEHIVDEGLLSVGRRTALERTAALILLLWRRSEQLGMVTNGALAFPLTQTHIADALGLSIVHVNRTLQVIRKRKLLELSGGKLSSLDEPALATLARIGPVHTKTRPLF
jgi:CRP/FNR family transcriptional regulator